MLKEYLNPPDSFSCDFEKGLLNTIQLTFEKCKVLGCWFHLSQNLWKHVQSYGLVEKYSSDKEFYKAFQRLKALPFVPCDDVVDAFKVIKCNSPVEFNLMLEYFETYYIGKLKKNSKSVREEPMFAIETWNVYERIEKDLPRANNNLEAWHKVFGNDCKKNPTLHKLINQFRLEQNLTEIILDQINSGDTYKRRNNK
ncbi:unnamed protein product [Brachionus calyciflorus]|uniref:MULE transposase domain-containing protein n=1 Tax=Brachionus calyciflorus TaxID=104777 RepID=A0A814PQX2_9BILA|nr:unnamed protein product [Brachionus calyciflorus]